MFRNHDFLLILNTIVMAHSLPSLLILLVRLHLQLYIFTTDKEFNG